jgi:plastocyanin
MFSRRLAAILLLAALPAGALAALQIVNQVGMTFQPATKVIQQGDTVRWVWADEAHTVTNGLGSASPGAGRTFDAPLDVARPSFEFTFNNLGNFPYFCRLHELMGMTGTIIVEAVVGADFSSFGKVKALYDGE